MSCPHGNHISACDICEEIDTAYSRGLHDCPDGMLIMPIFATEKMMNAVIQKHHLHPADVVDIYEILQKNSTTESSDEQEKQA